MSKLKVKIDGEYHDLCDVVDKPMVYFEQEEISKIKILTDIRDYLVTAKGRTRNSDMFILQIQAVENFADKALAYLKEYAEKLGVEL